MKKMLLFLTVIISTISLPAATISLQNNAIKHGHTVKANTQSFLDIEYGITDLNTETVKTEKGIFTKVSFKNGLFSRNTGAPMLPIFSDLIEIPAGSTPVIEVVSYDVKEYKASELGIDYPIFPVQPSLSKSSAASELYMRYNPVEYQNNEYNKDPLAVVAKSGIARGVGIGTVTVSPIQYNPKANMFKIYSKLQLRVKFNNVPADAKAKKNAEYSPYFDDVFKGIINYAKADTANDLTRYPVTYLIVANNALNGNADLNRFIAWKQQKGFKVVINYVASTTSITDIDNWIENQYNTLVPRPTFLLIVGDQDGTYGVKSELNPPVGGDTGNTSVSDLLYSVNGPLTMTHHIPSMYAGRFSVRTLADLTAQVDKTIWYEKTMFTSNADISYLSRVMGCAGADVNYQTIYCNPQIRYGWTWYFNNNANPNPLHPEPYGITGIPYLDGGTGQAANIISNVSTGVAFYNYTAHASNGYFSNPNFNIANVNNLNNSGKYGLIVGNCCLTGSFADAESFGEAWLNAPNKGAIGFLGASMNTFWAEDLVMGIGAEGAGSVASGDITPPFTPDTPGMYDGAMQMKFPTQGAIRYVGLMGVEKFNSVHTPSYWSAYHLFGDPSVMIYFGVPTDLLVEHAPTITSGVYSYTVNTVPGAYVAMSDDNGVLHGTAVANASGIAVINFSTPFVSGNAHLVATAQFKKPKFEEIPIQAPDVPFLTLKSYSVNNNNYGENATLDVMIKNVGTAVSNDINVSITLDSLSLPYATILDNMENYGSIAAGDSLMKNTAFTIRLANNVPDQQVIKIYLTLSDNATKNTYPVASATFIANSPVRSFSHAISGVGVTYPNTSRDLIYTISNTGHASMTNITVSLSQISALDLVIGNPTQSIGSIEAGTSASVTFPINFGSISAGSIANMKLHFTADKDISDDYTNEILIGAFPALILDIDKVGNSSAPSLKVALDAATLANIPIVTVLPADLTQYQRIFVCIGVYGTYYSSMPPAVGVLLKNFVNTGKGVYLEGGDTWNYDVASAVHPYFGIVDGPDSADGDSTGWVGSELVQVGEDVLSGISFVYEGDNRFMDSITVRTNGTVQMRNSISPTLVTNKTKKCVGSVFEFGGVPNDTKLIYAKKLLTLTGEYIDPSGIESMEFKPDQSELYQNYPNPFNPETAIDFFVREAGNTKITIYNQIGEMVTSFDKGNLKSGAYSVVFNGAGFSSGIYFYQLNINGKPIAVKKMILLK